MQSPGRGDKRERHGPFRGDAVKLVEEEHAWSSSRGALEQISDLVTDGVSSCDLSSKGEGGRTLFSDAPMYLFKISGPLTEMKLRPHSFATADARSVLPQPG